MPCCFDVSLGVLFPPHLLAIGEGTPFLVAEVRPMQAEQQPATAALAASAARDFLGSRPEGARPLGRRQRSGWSAVVTCPGISDVLETLGQVASGSAQSSKCSSVRPLPAASWVSVGSFTQLRTTVSVALTAQRGRPFLPAGRCLRPRPSNLGLAIAVVFGPELPPCDGETDSERQPVSTHWSSMRLGALGALSAAGVGPYLLASLLQGTSPAVTSMTVAQLAAFTCKGGMPPLYMAAVGDAVDLASLLAAFTPSGNSHQRIMLGLTLIWLFWGFVILPHQYNLTFAQTLYSLQEIMTTLGIGDIWPKTEIQKFSFGCFCLFTALFMTEGFIMITGSQSSQFAPRLATAPEEDPADRPVAPTLAGDSGWDAAFAASIAGAFLASGVLLNHLTMHCRCPPGVIKCIAEKCAELGGTPVTWADSFLGASGFMGTIFNQAMTPDTDTGKLMVSIWGIPAVVSTSIAAARLMRWLKESATRQTCDQVAQEKSTEFEGEEADRVVDRAEFQQHVLTSSGLVHPDDFALLDRQFSAMDDSQTGRLTAREMHRYFSAARGRAEAC